MTFDLGPALLFCPADRPDRFAKAVERADAVVLDLEDAVAPERKEAARAALVAADLDPARTIVRLNRTGTRDFDADLAAVTDAGIRMVMLAKAEVPADADLLLGFQVIAQIESARGVIEADALAGVRNVVALAWGSEDLVASLGGTSARLPDGRYRDVVSHARSRILLAAAAAGKACIDAVHGDIDDIDGLRAEAEDARAAGFSATACIHPNQVHVIRAAYAPTDDERGWATRVLAAAQESKGVFRFEGRMVDEPVLAQARRILAR